MAINTAPDNPEQLEAIDLAIKFIAASQEASLAEAAFSTTKNPRSLNRLFVGSPPLKIG
jgi:hypothetical protein